MHQEEVVQLFRDAGALLEGHFIYASGRHGQKFLQASRILQYPDITERLCRGLADKYRDACVDLVCGPATGGIILAYETARQLGCRAAFTEKEPDGSMALKRGFQLKPGTRTLVVEDIVTTGGTLRKSIEHLIGRGAEIIGVGALIDRSGGAVAFDQPFSALATLELESWAPDEVPAELAAMPVLEPDDLIV